MRDLQRLHIQDSSQVGEARRLVAALCRGLGFDETLVGKAAIVVTEMATNLLKHAGGGELLVRSIARPEAPGVEVLSLDRGPGISHPAESLRDGHSTSGSPGTGFGAIRRLSTVFDIYTSSGKGCAVLSCIWKKGPPETIASRPFEVGAVCLPAPGEEACGDAWAVHQSQDRGVFMVADGLGHGIIAAEAANRAVEVFQRNTALNPAQLLELIHGALRSTRGAAVAVAEVMLDRDIVRYAGVGNISGQIIDGGATRRMVSLNGTAGLEVRKVREFTYPWPAGGLLILHSDGLATRWHLGDYPGLPAKPLALTAGVLFRDHSRGRDDVTVVVARKLGRQM